MATDKSLSIRQIKAAEDTATALAEMVKRLDALQAQLDKIEAALAELKAQPSKMETVSRSVSARQKQ